MTHRYKPSDTSSRDVRYTLVLCVVAVASFVLYALVWAPGMVR